MSVAQAGYKHFHNESLNNVEMYMKPYIEGIRVSNSSPDARLVFSRGTEEVLSIHVFPHHSRNYSNAKNDSIKELFLQMYNSFKRDADHQTAEPLEDKLRRIERLEQRYDVDFSVNMSDKSQLIQHRSLPQFFRDKDTKFAFQAARSDPGVVRLRFFAWHEDTTSGSKVTSGGSVVDVKIALAEPLKSAVRTAAR